MACSCPKNKNRTELKRARRHKILITIIVPVMYGTPHHEELKVKRKYYRAKRSRNESDYEDSKLTTSLLLHVQLMVITKLNWTHFNHCYSRGQS